MILRESDGIDYECKLFCVLLIFRVRYVDSSDVKMSDIDTKWFIEMK